jgi:25S rRNA (uracil2634-N3)-methyltransferase
LTIENDDENVTCGKLMVATKSGEPYDDWNVKKLGMDAGLEFVRSFEFVPGDYEGYHHRRTLGFKIGVSEETNVEITKKPSRCWVFKN